MRLPVKEYSDPNMEVASHRRFSYVVINRDLNDTDDTMIRFR